jgi:hypothetical protein
MDFRRAHLWLRRLDMCMNGGRGGCINDGYSTPKRTRLPFHEHGKKFFFYYLFIFFNIKNSFINLKVFANI